MNPSPAGPRRKILVVEDEWMIAEHLSVLLQDLKYDVVGPVGNVKDALARTESQKIDGALLDANLNGTSSAPIADALSADRVPFIMITGYGGLELPTEAMNAAPRLTKPFTEPEIEKALAALLEVQAHPN